MSRTATAPAARCTTTARTFATTAERAAKTADQAYKTARDGALGHRPAITAAALTMCRAAARLAYAAALEADTLHPGHDDTARARRASDAAALAAADAETWAGANLDTVPEDTDPTPAALADMMPETTTAPAEAPAPTPEAPAPTPEAATAPEAPAPKVSPLHREAAILAAHTGAEAGALLLELKAAARAVVNVQGKPRTPAALAAEARAVVATDRATRAADDAERTARTLEEVRSNRPRNRYAAPRPAALQSATLAAAERAALAARTAAARWTMADAEARAAALEAGSTPDRLELAPYVTLLTASA